MKEILLQKPFFYNGFQHLVGRDKILKKLCQDYIMAKESDCILDVGCGTANIIDFLPNSCPYDGVDYDSYYIEHSRKKHINRKNTHFFKKDIDEVKNDITKKYDLILVLGVFHHIDNEKVSSFLHHTSKNILTKEGRLIVIDNVLTESQSFISRYIIKKDRGQFIRKENDYIQLFKGYFKNHSYDIRDDLLNIPYTHIITTCSN